MWLGRTLYATPPPCQVGRAPAIDRFRPRLGYPAFPTGALLRYAPQFSLNGQVGFSGRSNHCQDAHLPLSNVNSSAGFTQRSSRRSPTMPHGVLTGRSFSVSFS